MKSALMLLVLAGAMPAVVACGGPAGDTPDATFALILEAHRKYDWPAVWEMLAEPARKRFEAQLSAVRAMPPEQKKETAQRVGADPAELDGMDTKRFTILTMDMAARIDPTGFDQFVKATLIRSEITGIRAVVRFLEAGQEHQMIMVKEGDRWLIEEFR